MSLTEERRSALQTFIDNRPGNQMLDAVRRLIQKAHKLDVATGFFEVGALVDLDQEWQTLDELRLLMGDEMSRTTKEAFLKALQDNDKTGIERVKEQDDWQALEALDAIAAAIRGGKIKARVYTRNKFHAKALHFYTGDVVNHGIIGSSNFTRPGLTQNLELNLFTSDRNQLGPLAEWYEKAWDEAEDLHADLLRVVERHTKPFDPFEVYLQAMRTYFLNRKRDDTVWEMTESKLYPNVLAQYQRDAYHDLMHMAKTWGGGLLCDGVGLGKTFVALMLIERALKDGHRVLIIAPKAAIPSVWERHLNHYFPEDFHPSPLIPTNISVIAHTDLGRDGGINDALIERMRRTYQTIIVDEAHHFRVARRNRSLKLARLTRERRTFLLTATPINNSLLDLYILLNYITDGNDRLFEPLNVPKLRPWFTDRSNELVDEQKSLDIFQRPEYEEFLKHIIVQRSRTYVKEIDKLQEHNIKFPKRELPEVIPYSLKKIYGDLFDQIIKAFDKAKLKLVLYETERFKVKDRDKAALQEQANVVGLIRTMLLKRMESSQVAFEASVEDMLYKHAVILQDANQLKWMGWQAKNQEAWKTVEKHRRARLGIEEYVGEEEELPELTAYEHRRVEELRADRNLFGETNKQEWLKLLEMDMTILVNILKGLYEQVTTEKDDKMRALVDKIQSTPRLKKDKFVIFSEFKDTARYLETELKKRLGETDTIVEVDSGRNVKNRDDVIRRFAPHYNCENEEELQSALKKPIRVLISTDVLSEGLNLQDANIIINYDLHWNPVRLMQRIGRVDRRMDTSKPVKYDKVYVYNFLPPGELNDVLSLYQRVTDKLIAINKTLGIEAPVLQADDDYKARDLYLNMGLPDMPKHERLRLKAHDLEKHHPELWKRTETFPYRVFSGKAASPSLFQGEGRGGGLLFLAYSIPIVKKTENGEQTEDDVRWYMVNLQTGEITDDIWDIHEAIQCAEGTPRVVKMPREKLTDARRKVEEDEVKKVLFKSGIPADRPARLICWMEIS